MILLGANDFQNFLKRLQFPAEVVRIKISRHELETCPYYGRLAGRRA